MYQLYRLRAERSANQALITELRKERGKLEEENFRLKTDMEYIERIARERYRMVKKGEKVKQGDIIGTVGSTGRATGAHLDVRLNWFQTRLDPATVLDIN